VAGTVHASDDNGRTVPERVRITLARTTARIEARYAVEVGGGRSHLENVATFALPERAVVTGAVVRVGGHVQRLELAEVPTVDQAFRALFDAPGVGTKRRWAARLDHASG